MYLPKYKTKLNTFKSKNQVQVRWQIRLMHNFAYQPLVYWSNWIRICICTLKYNINKWREQINKNWKKEIGRRKWVYELLCLCGWYCTCGHFYIYVPWWTLIPFWALIVVAKGKVFMEFKCCAYILTTISSWIVSIFINISRLKFKVKKHVSHFHTTL